MRKKIIMRIKILCPKLKLGPKKFKEDIKNENEIRKHKFISL